LSNALPKKEDMGVSELQGCPREDVISLLSKLVSINSVNPSLVDGQPGEKEVALFVAEWLKQAGLEVDLQEAAPQRSNVIARVPGTSGGRSLILNAHMDTVGFGGMSNPLAPKVKRDRLYGRGSYDMKGGLAAIMLAARSVRQAGGADGDVIITAVVDEEYSSLGTEAVVASLAADAAIVTEPTSMRICLAHKGFAWISITTSGRAAHGSRADLGVDAIAHMGRVLADIESLEAELESREPHVLLGCASVHASLIEGGQELSTYPEDCRLQVERRTVPGEASNDVLEEIRARLASRAAEDPNFAGTAELFFWRDPFEVSMNEAIVASLLRASTDILKAKPQFYGDTPWMDAALFSAAGIPTVVFGPGGAGAHSTDEYVLISEVAQCADVLAETAFEYCRKPIANSR
jgi:acetylornithine deacetylase